MLDSNNTFLTDIIYVNKSNEEIQVETIGMDIEYKEENIKNINKSNYRIPIDFYYFQKIIWGLLIEIIQMMKLNNI